MTPFLPSPKYSLPFLHGRFPLPPPVAIASPVLEGGVLPQTYLLKLARSGEDGEKVFLVLESGTRFHTTQVCHAFRLTRNFGALSNLKRGPAASVARLACVRTRGLFCHHPAP